MPHEGSEQYHQQVASTRQVALGLSGATVAELLDTLDDWGEEIEELIAEDLATSSEADLLRRIDRFTDDLRDDLARETGDAIQTTVDRVVEIHERAALELVETSNVSGLNVSGPFDDVSPAAFAAVAEREELSETFTSIQDELTDAADRIIAQGVLRGASGRQIGRRLRHFVVGADRMPDRILRDRRSISPEVVEEEFGLENATEDDVEQVREEARTIARHADMIGRNEPINAHGEARARSAMASPTVFAISWNLSNRHVEFDVCDILAGETGWDPFGLGPGRYPPAALPVRPHPDCLRVLRDVLAEPEDWGEDSSATPIRLQEDPGEVAAEEGMYPSEQDALRSAFSAPNRDDS